MGLEQGDKSAVRIRKDLDPDALAMMMRAARMGVTMPYAVALRAVEIARGRIRVQDIKRRPSKERRS
ncbi:MAG TPA: hypothetical protein VLF20_05580 [Patescibacteria group bacterium]|nr:hypothetical protein [Patescibacteria group bacterium]